MAYSSIDIAGFSNQAVQEGNRIKNLISQFPFNAGTVIAGLIRHNIIDVEELLGIEHLIGRDAREQVRENRRAHVMLILGVQNRLRETGLSSAETLARVAQTNSSESIRKGRSRALLAV